MNIDNEISEAMRKLAIDSPAEAEIAATVRNRINRRHTLRRAVLTSAAGVATVAVIVTTASLLPSRSQPDQINVVSPPSTLASSTTMNDSPTPATVGSIEESLSPTTVDSVSEQLIPASSAPMTTPPTIPAVPEVTGFSARCYTTADIGRTDNHLAISLNAPIGPHAMGICQQDWEQGTLSSTAPFIRDRPIGPGQSVPALVTCVLPAELSDEGVEEVAVFPGTDETCGQLNLPQYTG